MKKRIFLALLSIALIFSNSILSFAATKNAIGLENNNPTGTSDAKAFVDGIKDQDSDYTTSYKGPTSVSNSDFWDKSYTIKYWSSHGSNNGNVWGEDSDVNLNIFDQSFSWAGGELEFAFLAACRQLDGSGSNTRSRYANAMVGNKAVRVICGYHESAPAAKDKDVADKFIEYAKTGESVKSSWILANKYWQDKGWSTGVYCVLTHSGNVQYSRFPGFPGSTYTRPGSSSTSILRFSSANPNGTSQTYSSGLLFNNDISGLSAIEVPSYVLQATPVNFTVQDGINKSVLKNDNDIVIIGGEIGDQELTISNVEIVEKYQEEVSRTISNYSDLNTESAIQSITPIIMAEVNLDGGDEIERVVAYDITVKNTYNGIEILGDYVSGIIGAEDASYIAANWNNMNIVDMVKSRANVVDFDTACQMISAQLSINARSFSATGNVSVNEAKLAFTLNENSGYYEPTWIFNMDNAVSYRINCLNSTIQIFE